MPDGVQITLLWFEPQDAPSDAPVVVSLHGIGGDENSVRPIKLAEECLKRGWVSVLYVRRGHGESSLLPVGAAAAPPSAGKAAAADVEMDVMSSVSESVMLAGAAEHKSPLYAGPPLPSEGGSVGTSRAGACTPRPDAAAPAEAAANTDHNIAPPNLQTSHGAKAGADGAVPTAAVTAAAATAAATAEAATPASAAALTAVCSPASPASPTTAGPSPSGHSSSSLDSLAACLPRNLNLNLNLPAVNLPAVNLPSLNLPALPSFPNLPTLNLPPVNFHSLGWPGWPGWPAWQAQPGTPAANSVAGASSAMTDRDSLLRVRKAFPQHADTEDFHRVLRHIRAARPAAPMVAVGFSMGSNVLVKYLGEHTATERPAGPATAGAAVAAANGEVGGAAGGGSGVEAEGVEAAEAEGLNPLTAAVSVCNGYDIVEGTRELVSRRPLADRIITAALHKLLRRRLPEVHAICAAHGLLVDFDEVLACNTLHEFERALMLPICGVPDLDAYYERNNCREALQHVSVPLLCLSARDDPIIDPRLLRHAEAAAAANPRLLLAVTQRGGHLGWMAGWRGSSWMMEVIVEFVQAAVATAAAERRGAPAAGGGAAGGEAAVEVRSDSRTKGEEVEVEVVAAAGVAPSPPPAAGAALAATASVEITVAEEADLQELVGSRSATAGDAAAGAAGGEEFAQEGPVGLGEVVILVQE